MTITLSGTGGHTSRPHLTADLVGALGALATKTQLLLSRRVDPRSGVSLMWGSDPRRIGGQRHPRSGRSRARCGRWTCRLAAGQAADPELASQIVRPFGVEVEVSVTDGVPPAVNHPRGVERLTRAAEADPRSAGGDRHRAVAGRRGLRLDAAAGAGCPGPARGPSPRASSFPTSTSPPSTWTRSCIRVGVKVLAAVASRPIEHRRPEPRLVRVLVSRPGHQAGIPRGGRPGIAAIPDGPVRVGEQGRPTMRASELRRSNRMFVKSCRGGRE